MNLRVARHTKDLQKIADFYTKVVGLSNLGGFKDHAGYDGVFLGIEQQNWHLEFTCSEDQPASKFDEDDALVFYLHSELEFVELKNSFMKHNIQLLVPKNPYWQQNGLMIEDPDGFKVVFAIRHLLLDAADELTKLVKGKKIRTWSDLLDYVKALPYRRNANREDFSLVLKENQGTCSSKHALVKKVAQLNSISNVKLIMSIYKMNHSNTPKIGNTIVDAGLEYIPEAHCYLMLNNRRYDLTSSKSSIHNLIADVLEETEIEPEQVNTYKVQYHKAFLKQWIAGGATNLSFEQVWAIREQCIVKMGE